MNFLCETYMYFLKLVCSPLWDLRPSNVRRMLSMCCEKCGILLNTKSVNEIMRF